MDLIAGVARLQHHRVVFDEDLVGPLDVQPVRRSTADAVERIVERVVARHGRDAVHGQIGLAQSGQDAAQNDIGPLLLGGGARLVDQLLDLHLHRRKTTAPQELGLEVGFQIEERQFSCEGTRGQVPEHIEGGIGGTPAPVHQEELLLDAEAADAGFDHPPGKHLLEGLEVPQDRLGKGADFR